MKKGGWGETGRVEIKTESRVKIKKQNGHRQKGSFFLV